MRRPWIKIETCTPDKPEVCAIATQLRMDEDMVVGKLVRLWAWAELNRIQPNDIGVTKEFIDKLVGRKGFAAALAQTGWLVETDGKLSFRNFKRHNSPVAQNKALTAKRVARHRLRKAATEKKDTVKPLAKAVKEVLEEAPPAVIEEVTIQTLPEPAIETLKVEEIADFVDTGSDVIISDSTLIISEEIADTNEQEPAEPVTIPVEPSVVVQEVEMPPEITPEEALAALQVEEPAPRKKRSKAAAASDDQPMLF